MNDDQHERELQDLLHGVVPDAPRIDPAPLVAAGRRSRTRRRTGVVTAAAAAVVLAVATPAVLTGSDDGGELPQVVTPVFDPPPDEVYAAVPCPAELPSTSRSNKVIPDLDRVVGARLCGDVGTSPTHPEPNRGPAPSYPASPDALVDGVPDFVERVRALPTPDPERCATIDAVSSRQALVFELNDGSTVLLGQGFCGDNELDGRPVDASAVVQSFLEALDAQRDAQSYQLGLDDLALGCDADVTHSPATPGREQVAYAVGCTEDGDALMLRSSGLPLLRAAWDAPLPVAEELNDFGENECTELETRPRDLLLTTDRGDVVRLFESPCGDLGYSSWRLGESFRIPVSYDEVVSDRPLELPAPTPAPDPYDANTCPAEPPPDSADADVTGLEVDVEAVVSVTYCDAFATPTSPLTPEAFVGDAATLQEAVASVRPMSPLQCLKLSFGLEGFVTVTLADGDAFSVASDCRRIEIAGARLAARQLPQVFLAALNRQRYQRAYGADADYFACDLDGRTGPVDPARDALVLADTCISHNKPALRPLTPRALDLLRARWAEASPISDSELEECYTAADPTEVGYLTVTTERGDVVRLTPSACGYFVPEPPGAALDGPRYAVPVTFEELGNAAEVARQHDAYVNGPDA